MSGLKEAPTTYTLFWGLILSLDPVEEEKSSFCLVSLPQTYLQLRRGWFHRKHVGDHVVSHHLG